MRRVVGGIVIVSLIAPSITPLGLALDQLPKPWLLQAVTGSSTESIAGTMELVTGRLLTSVKRDYRWSIVLPSSA
jgi:hypothetical protein